MLVVSPNNPTGSFLHADDLVPLAELFGYATELRSRTQGRAAHSPMQLHAYNEVPAQIGKEIVARVMGE